MNLLNYIIMYFASCLTIIITLLSFKKLIKSERINNNILFFIVFILGSIIITINVYIVDGPLKILYSFFVLYILAICWFKENFVKTFLYMLTCYIIMLLFEIVLSSIVMIFNFVNIESFNNNIIYKIIFTFITLLCLYLTSNIKKIDNFLKKFSSKIKENQFVIILFLIIFIAFTLVDFKYASTFSSGIYRANVILTISLLLFLVLSIYNYFKANKEIEKTEVLLNFMSKYEKIIDDNRVNRHEMLNNLLMLKCIKNKNSKEYNELLDSLIDNSSNRGIKIKNIYNLPSGLKGIFYYKLYGLENKNYNININVSKLISKSIEKISHDNYTILYRVVGIILDNAIEAASLTTNKIINVDIYKENNSVVIEISNSYKGEIDLNKINNKDYSTKGEGRGLGLYIINNLIKNNDNISLNQEIIDDIFCSKIIVK